jgi:hypothetical protein
MKTTIKLFAISLLIFFSSCKKDKEATPEIPCKLSTIDRGNLNKHFYAYDIKGKITTMTREFDGNGSGKVSKYVYTMIYDADGLLTSSTFTLDGVANGKEKYNYTNGKVTRTDFEYTDGTKGYNAIKYDANGQILEFSYQGNANTDDDYKAYFAYDANGVLIKRGYSDMSGTSKFFEVIVKPVGFVKSPEALLNNNGLPYDLLTGFSYSKAEGGIGTTFEAYGLDEKGVFAKFPGIGKTTAIKANTKGYLIETTVDDTEEGISTQKFELTDCQ